jgi:hypothetical protein
MEHDLAILAVRCPSYKVIKRIMDHGCVEEVSGDSAKRIMTQRDLGCQVVWRFLAYGVFKCGQNLTHIVKEQRLPP